MMTFGLIFSSAWSLPLFFVSVITVTSPASNWMVQVCFGRQSYNISRSHCDSLRNSRSQSVGIWLEKPTNISRACFNGGVWAVYKNWCQKPIVWTVGTRKKNGCMDPQLLQNALGMVYLGSEYEGIVIGSTRLRIIYNIAKKSSWELLDKELEIVTWGHRIQYKIILQNQNEETEIICLMESPAFFRQYKFKNHVLNSPVRISVSEESCAPLGSSKFYGGFQLLPVPQVKSFLELRYTSVYLPANTILNCQDLEPTDGFENLRDPDPTRATEIMKLINEQSFRMALKFEAHIFRETSLQNLDTMWDIFEASKTLFQRTCATHFIPSDFVDKMFLLIRIVLTDSDLRRQRSLKRPSEQSLRRIEQALATCKATATEYVLEELEHCTNNVVARVKYRNETLPKPSIINRLPGYMQTDPNDYDLILEIAWKLILLTHYKCAAYFQKIAGDFSALYASVWEELLADELLVRWTNPGKLSKLIELFIGRGDLEIILRNVDNCVAAAHSESPYLLWMKRPFQFDGNRNLVLTKYEIWDGNAYCMDNYIFPGIRLGLPLKTCSVQVWSVD